MLLNLSPEPLPPCLQQVTRRARRFFLGPNRAVVPNPTDEANGCILGYLTPKPLQKALYVGVRDMADPYQQALEVSIVSTTYKGWQRERSSPPFPPGLEVTLSGL